MPADALPSQRYAAGVAEGHWQDDPAQRAVLVELDRIHTRLIQSTQSASGWLGKWFGRDADPVRGLYVWGGVGRGKTFLVDLFFDTLPLPGKRRLHFHRFMRQVHEQLRQHADTSDRLALVAQDWARDIRLLVLDECFVSDIGDAMLLGRLLQRLFAEGVTLVTTSNTAPDNLYAGGLQRERFLPAIAQIKQHCVVHHMDSATDYRLRALTDSPVYRSPLDAESDAWLARRWRELGGDAPRAGSVDIEGRAIAVRGEQHGMLWFDFADLCEGPRAAGDYIEIASEYHTVLLGGIPRFTGGNDDPARRFVTAIDEFYDRRVKLVCTAAADPVQLYTGDQLAGAFERTASRLIEMRSADYLAQPHLG